MYDVWLVIGGYLLGWIITARLLFVAAMRDGAESDGFASTFLALAWPVMLGGLVVLAPFVAVGWLVSRPVRHR